MFFGVKIQAINYNYESRNIYSINAKRNGKKKTKLADQFNGVQFRIVKEIDNGKVVGETTVTNNEEFQKFNIEAKKTGGLPHMPVKER